MPWLKKDTQLLPSLKKGQTIPLSKVELHSGMTSPPGYVTESELL